MTVDKVQPVACYPQGVLMTFQGGLCAIVSLSSFVRIKMRRNVCVGFMIVIWK